MIAKRNERWMKNKGGVEKEGGHYKLFVLVHVLFFLSIFIEAYVRGVHHLELNHVLLLIFILTQMIRVWCIQSLGRFWNTKIIVNPKFSPVAKGPYKYVKHPNYVVVGIELFVIPLLFGAIYTAILFPFLHILLLAIRIPAEERALAQMEKRG
ncbi:isoprenylcysteine carboxyl methyltransferase family protein [Virgibacillus xinjiangensis]|uniref:Isoprenylcysteine carboxyl methyltransferase family protein n=1 Tax=Virgibacillus xinjiangensis TaxID=393090 RepID=A0ABV7CRG9_9BACI